MEPHRAFNLATALLFTVLVRLAAAAGTAAAGPAAPCELRVRVELTSDVPHPLEAGFVNSLLSTHSTYRLTLRQQDPYDPSVIALDLSGSGPQADCREVVSAMRKDARVVSVEVQRDADATAPALASTVQPMGTVQAGTDGDWVLEPLNGVSSVREARDRYECDIWAVDQTGFDPTQDDGGVPPDVVPGKRADYLRAEAACFQARCYLVK